MSVVTNIAKSDGLNGGKLDALREQAGLLGRLRAELWRRFGSLSGVGVGHREVRDEWVKTRDFSPLSAKSWKETLRNVLDDIHSYEEACKKKVAAEVYRRTSDEEEIKRFLDLLYSDQWPSDRFLSRRMRHHKKHGKTSVDNQIIVEGGQYNQFKGKNGNTWIKVPSLVKGKRIAIPLNTKAHISGAIRLILRDDHLEVHHTLEKTVFEPCGEQTIAVDKGYTEAFADSEGNFYGVGYGKIMTSGTEVRHRKGIARNKLHQLQKNHKNPRKKRNIAKYNLGRKELEKRDVLQQKQLRGIAFEAAHRVVDKAAVVVAEDLSSPFSQTKDRGKEYNRRMNSWAKGYLAEALETVTETRSSSLRVVNAAYTSQIDSNTRRLEGRRVGDRFHHANGDVSHADTNAAKNILHRLADTDIKLYTPFRQVKKILQDRLLATGGVTETSAPDRPSGTPVTRRKRTLTENKLTNNSSKNGP